MCLELPVTEVEFDLCRVVMASRSTVAFVSVFLYAALCPPPIKYIVLPQC
jgi:hypothetical protein